MKWNSNKHSSSNSEYLDINGNIYYEPIISLYKSM